MDNRQKIPGREIFKENTVEVNGVKINYAEAGEGEVLLFVHGLVNNWMGWIPVASILQKKYRVILVDLLGYGDSSSLGEYSLEIQATYLAGLVEKLGVKKITMIGLSMGTYVISKFYSMYPTMIDRAILIGPVFRNGNRKRAFEIGARLLGVVKKSDQLGKLIKRLVAWDQSVYFYSKHVQMYHYDQQTIDWYGSVGRKKMTSKALVEMGLEVARTDNDELISDNKVPFLLVYGDHDKITHFQKAVRCLEGVGTYDFAVIGDAGHIVTVEKPTEVARTISRFLKTWPLLISN